MDAGREIDQDNRPATRAERWFVQSEISLGVALTFAVAIVLALASLYFLISVVVALLVE